MILSASSEDIVYTPLFSGTHANYLLASIEAAGVTAEEARMAKPQRMKAKSDPERPKAWKDVWSAGQAVAQSRKLRSTGEVIDRLDREYRAARRRIGA